MAKKRKAFSGDRTDPKQNKSLAIRTVLQSMPTNKAADVAAEVKKQYGHSVGSNQIYMIKTKLNMSRNTKAVRRASKSSARGKLSSAVMWVDAIKIAKHLLEATGSVENATALLRAIGD